MNQARALACFVVLVITTGQHCSQTQKLVRPVDFTRCLPFETTCYVEVTNTQRAIEKLYSNIFSYYRSTPKLKDPATFRNYEPKEHWLGSVAVKLLTSDNVVAKDLSSTLRKIVESKESVSTDDERQVVEAISRLFPGRSFFSLLDEGDDACFLFGFEYNPAVFDWDKEIKLACAEQLQPVDLPVAMEHEFYYLKNDCIIFFTFGNTLFGYTGSCVKNFVDFSDRVRGKTVFGKTLTDNRFFSRAAAPLEFDEQEFDVFCFMNSRQFPRFLRMQADPLHEFGPPVYEIGTPYPEGSVLEGEEPPPKNRVRIFEIYKFLGWDSMFGAVARFDVHDNLVQYKTVFPLTIPMDETTKMAMESAMADLDPSKRRCIYPFRNLIYLAVNDVSAFPRFPLSFGNGGEFEWGFWKQSRMPLKYGLRSLSFEQHLNTSFDGKGMETCRFRHFYNSTESRQLGGITPGLMGVVVQKADIKIENVEDLAESLNHLLHSDEFAEVRKVADESFSNARKGGNQIFKSLQSRFQKDPKKYAKELADLGANKDRVEAISGDAPYESDRLTVKRSGVANACLVDVGDELGVVSGLTASILELLAARKAESFIADKWFGEKAFRGKSLKVLAIASESGWTKHDVAFRPAFEVFRRLLIPFQEVEFDGTPIRSERTPSERSLMSDIPLAFLGFGFGEFARVRTEEKLIHSLALVYENGESIEYHGLIRQSK